jgi:hypothetical protein
MTVWVSETFIVSSESGLRLILYFILDGVINRLFGLGCEKGTELPEMKLSGAPRLIKTIDKES